MERFPHYCSLIDHVDNEQIKQLPYILTLNYNTQQIQNVEMQLSNKRVIFRQNNQYIILDLSDIITIDVKSKIAGCICGGSKYTLQISFVYCNQQDFIQISDKTKSKNIISIKTAIDNVKEQKQAQPQQTEYKSGYKAYLNQDKQKIQGNIQQARQAMLGDFNYFFNQAQEIKSTVQYLSNFMQGENPQLKNTEDDNILKNIELNVIMKEEAGDTFYQDLAQQIYILCSELFKHYGGIISIIDVYYYMNKKRQTALLSAKEIMLACNEFEKQKIPLRLAIYDNNIKVIESKDYNSMADFKNNILKHFKSKDGITPETLAEKLKISLPICRLKLQLAAKEGIICLADRIEGQLYYRNILLEQT